jgi:outer membrane lipoprotein SlyB
MPNIDDAPREVAQTVRTGAVAQPRKMHPMMIVAAGAVTLFSAVGIAVMTGIIPSAHSNKSTGAASTNAPASSMPVTAAAAGAAAAGIGNVTDAAPSAPATSTKPIESGTMGQPLQRAEQQAAQRAPVEPKPAPKPHAAPKPAPASASASKPVVVAQAPVTTAVPGSSTERAPSAPRLEEVPTPVYAQNGNPNNTVLKPDNVPAICATCGVVDGIYPVEQAGQGSGAGAVLGGVVGGVLGHQVGKGRGRDVATVAGAVGGAVLGNQIEKGAKTTRGFDIRVRMENNTFQTVRSDVDPGLRVGDKVRVENGRLVR